MPELPEVQTFIETLIDKGVLNKTIKRIDIFKPKLLKNISPEKFVEQFTNQTIIKIERIGKYLIFKFTNKLVLCIHLRMEGKLFYEQKQGEYKKEHMMVSFLLDNEMFLSYYDSRMFGTFHVSDEDHYLELKEIKKIAIDPLNDSFNGQMLYDKIHKLNKYIKPVLLDQEIVSGIGNIYADEILFASKIHPQIKAKELTLTQCNLIAENAKKVLGMAVKNKGTTIHSYMFDEKSGGGFQNMLKVHTKKGFKCPDCNELILKSRVAGRGTYYCPECQLRTKYKGLICVTGQTGVGKTTVMNFIKEEGYETFLMDEYIHQIYKKDQIGYKAIKVHFGDQYLYDKGVDRKKLGELVFNDPLSLKKLNDLMIPLMINKIKELKQANYLIFVEMAIYLNHIETFKPYFDQIVLLTANEDIIHNALKSKFGHLNSQLKNPINEQLIEQSIVIQNNDNLIKLKNQTLKKLEQALK